MFTPENSRLHYLVVTGFTDQKTGVDCASCLYLMENGEYAVTLPPEFVADMSFCDTIARVSFSDWNGSIDPKSLHTLDEINDRLKVVELSRIQIWPEVGILDDHGWLDGIGSQGKGGAPGQQASSRAALEANIARVSKVDNLQ